jgi:cystathionine gamma-synthase
MIWMRWKSARQPGTKGVFIETPTNPLMMITDIEAVCTWAKATWLLTIVDNTLLTPFFQRPIELGADIIVHSATKYLGGHNDVLAGLIVTKGEELSAEMAILHNSIGRCPRTKRQLSADEGDEDTRPAHGAP